MEHCRMHGRELCAHAVCCWGAEAGVQGEGLPPVALRLAGITGRAERVAEALLRMSLLITVTRLDGQAERGTILRAGVAGLSRCHGCFPQPVESLSLASQVAGLAEDADRLIEVGRGLLGTALPQLGDAQSHQRVRLTNPVAGLTVRVKCLPEMVRGLRAHALAQFADTEVGKRPGLAVPVVNLAEQDEGLLLIIGGAREAA